MMVLASVMPPVGDHGRAASSSGDALDGHVLLLDALAVVGHLGEVAGEEHARSLVAEARASCGRWPAARSAPAARPTSSASSRSAVTLLGPRRRRRACRPGSSSSSCVERGAVLAHEA